MLEEGLVADFDPGPGGSPRGRGKGGGATMLFGVPGAAADTEVSYEEWQAAYNRCGGQERAHPPHPQDPPAEPQASVPMVGGVMMAWDSSSSEYGSDSQLGEEVEIYGAQQGVGGDSQQGTRGVRGDRRERLGSREVIKNEW